MFGFFALTVALCICTTYSQHGSGAASSFNTTQISNIQTDILNGYLVNTRPSDSMVINVGFGVHHITKLVQFYYYFFNNIVYIHFVNTSVYINFTVDQVTVFWPYNCCQFSIKSFFCSYKIALAMRFSCTTQTLISINI